MLISLSLSLDSSLICYHGIIMMTNGGLNCVTLSLDSSLICYHGIIMMRNFIDFDMQREVVQVC